MFGVRKLAYNCRMTKQQLIKKAGSRKALAELLGISLAAISQWTVVPKARLWQLKDLRPQWFSV
jgi:predicted transcriptional regulator